MKLLTSLCLSLLLWPAAARAEAPVILVTLKPLAWVVQALVPEGIDVQVLMPAGQSAHDYTLRPADVVRVRQASLLVWVGPGLESWLAPLARQLPAGRQWALLPHGSHAHGTPDHEASLAAQWQQDPHLWLDPLALREQAPALATALRGALPDQAAAIESRLPAWQAQLTALDAELAAGFAPVASRGFVVYHDGYQRLVQRYHLNQKAAVWQHESIPPGARERARLLEWLDSGEVQCLFYEPEHGAAEIDSWLGSAAQRVRRVELDMLGTRAVGYPQFLRELAGSMTACLAQP